MTAPAITDLAKLNIGAGRSDHLAGAVRLDIARAVHPHVVADLDAGGLPFKAGCFDAVGAYDVVEHVEDLVALMEEIHRVLRPDGVVYITTPHFSSANAFTDPTHRRALSLRSFDYFDGAHPLAYYSAARFRIRTARLFFKGRVLGRLFFRVAQRWPAWYEERLAWLFPAWFLYFELVAVK
ncbi:MAG: class I SAM-dependent methyltransferase [Gemmatimonadales bacterium]|jgi:SAM-dependent methyltransferase